MKLNGWQRLWVVLSIAWIGYVIYGWARASIYARQMGWGELDASFVIPVFGLIAFGVPLLVYGAGAIVAWVIRGFRTPKA